MQTNSNEKCNGKVTRFDSADRDVYRLHSKSLTAAEETTAAKHNGLHKGGHNYTIMPLL